MNYGSDVSGTHLVSSFWYLDSSAPDGKLTADKDNKSYTTQLNYLIKSQTVALYGRLHADLFNSYRMTINGVDTNISVTRAPEVFYFLGPSEDTEVRIIILDATIFVTEIELKPPTSSSSC